MQLINPNQPINKKHKLNRGLMNWWLAHPQFCRGNQWKDLTGRLNGQQIRMYNPNTTVKAGFVGAQGNPGGYGSMMFDGFASYVNLDRSQSLSLEIRSFTVFMVIKPNLFQNTRTIFGRASGGGSITGWSVGIDDTVNNKLKFFIGGSGQNNTLTSRSSIPVQQWTTCSFVGDRIGPDPVNFGSRSIYINGILDQKANNTFLMSFATQFSSIGRWEGGQAQYFNGAIASLMFYNRVLSDSENKMLHYQAKDGYIGQLNFLRTNNYIGGISTNIDNIINIYNRKDYHGIERGVGRGVGRGVI